MKDQLSALIDGEFDVASAEHLITSIQSGGEMESCWQHYHLIGDAMRGDRYLSSDFSARVMSALEAEPTVLAPKAALDNQIERKKSLFQSNQFWSIAASVAAVMFVGMMVLQQQLTSSEDMAPVEMAQIVPLEYIAAHQAAAPSGAAYYIQNVNANINSAGQ
ncbi:sigma-E factor negative regulatory protein [Methylotenera versatilis]|uniref:sigma-E factor negative regulatory protein n=1 Tax=Methylotenera versatilis TaxID=1055487 RepID=UPI0006475E5D|nr:sigma-E factor negative regulatory protein [Methylotenera versatilis]